MNLNLDLAQAENFRKLLISSSDDIRVLLVKLADRLHNIRTIDGIKDKQRQLKICKETLEIYVPLAERLGIIGIQSELEEKCFFIINNETRNSIQKRLDLIYSEDKVNIPLIIKEIKKIAFDKKMFVEITGRKKTCYSIWKKMQTKKLEWIISQTLWLFELLSKKEDCYKLLSLLHQNYTAIMGRFKDYISAPKRNGYQSLHTA